jgi:hypothetical protein
MKCFFPGYGGNFRNTPVNQLCIQPSEPTRAGRGSLPCRRPRGRELPAPSLRCRRRGRRDRPGPCCPCVSDTSELHRWSSSTDGTALCLEVMCAGFAGPRVAAARSRAARGWLSTGRVGDLDGQRGSHQACYPCQPGLAPHRCGLRSAVRGDRCFQFFRCPGCGCRGG